MSHPEDTRLERVERGEKWLTEAVRICDSGEDCRVVLTTIGSLPVDDVAEAVRDQGGLSETPALLLLDVLNLVRAERDAYKRAKAENDDRFMCERDEARADCDTLRAEAEQLMSTIRDLQGEKGFLKARLSAEQKAHSMAMTETRVLLTVYAMTHGPIRVSDEFAREMPARVSARFDPMRAVYEVVGADRGQSSFQSGNLVLLAVRYVTTTMTEDNADALLQALQCPAVCAADPVRLGTAATELAHQVDALRGGRRESVLSPLSLRAEVLARCCRLLLPYLGDRDRAEVLRLLSTNDLKNEET